MTASKSASSDANNCRLKHSECSASAARHSSQMTKALGRLLVATNPLEGSIPAALSLRQQWTKMDSLDLPPDLARISDLGPVEAVYRSAPPSLWPMIYKWLVFMVVFGAIAAIGYFGGDQFKRHGMEMVGVGASMIGFFGLIVIGAGGAFIILFNFVADRVISITGRRVIVVYRDGIAELHKRKLEVWPWSDIREIYADLSSSPASGAAIPRRPMGQVGVILASREQKRFDLVHRDGRRITVSQYLGHVDELIAKVREKVYPLLRSDVNRAIAAGEPVEFGSRLVVEREGLRIAGVVYPWEEIREYRADRVVLSLAGPKPAPPMLPIDAIPNSELLIAILNEKVSTNRRDTPR
jgi:hypothetical protein